MADILLWTILGIIIALLIVFIIVVRRKGNHTIDYRALFILGVVFIPIGASTKNYFMWVLGLCLMAFSLANHKKWKEKKAWGRLTKKQRKQRMWIVISLGIVLLIGLILFLIMNLR